MDDSGGARDRDLIQPVRPVDGPDAGRAEFGEHAGQRLGAGAVGDAEELTRHPRRIAQGPRRLKIVRTGNSARTGATWRMAP